jgi:hypothetical protein
MRAGRLPGWREASWCINRLRDVELESAPVAASAASPWEELSGIVRRRSSLLSVRDLGARNNTPRTLSVRFQLSGRPAGDNPGRSQSSSANDTSTWALDGHFATLKPHPPTVRCGKASPQARLRGLSLATTSMTLTLGVDHVVP